MKNQFNNFCAFFIYMHNTVYDIISKHITTENNAFFHLAFLSPFYTLACFAAFLLCK